MDMSWFDEKKYNIIWDYFIICNKNKDEYNLD